MLMMMMEQLIQNLLPAVPLLHAAQIINLVTNLWHSGISLDRWVVLVAAVAVYNSNDNNNNKDDDSLGRGG